jgi:hypothetical protein
MGLRSILSNQSEVCKWCGLNNPDVAFEEACLFNACSTPVARNPFWLFKTHGCEDLWGML